MEISATLSLPLIPKASPSIPLASCNSIFFNNGRTDLSKKSNRLILCRKRAQGGLNCRSMFGLGVPEIVVIAGVATLLFGLKKLPKVGRTIGQTIKSFQKVHKQGIAPGRSVDLTKFNGCDELIADLDQMFEFNGELMAPNKSWLIVYTDNEGDCIYCSP